MTLASLMSIARSLAMGSSNQGGCDDGRVYCKIGRNWSRCFIDAGMARSIGRGGSPDDLALLCAMMPLNRCTESAVKTSRLW